MSLWGRQNVRRICETLTLAATIVGPAAAELKKPGESGQIKVTFNHLEDSAEALTDLTLAVAAPPGFIVKPTSSLGPVTLAPNSNHVFLVDFKIDDNAATGAINVGLVFASAVQGVDLNNPELSVTLTIVGGEGDFPEVTPARPSIEFDYSRAIIGITDSGISYGTFEVHARDGIRFFGGAILRRDTLQRLSLGEASPDFMGGVNVFETRGTIGVRAQSGQFVAAMMNVLGGLTLKPFDVNYVQGNVGVGGLFRDSSNIVFSTMGAHVAFDNSVGVISFDRGLGSALGHLVDPATLFVNQPSRIISDEGLDELANRRRLSADLDSQKLSGESFEVLLDGISLGKWVFKRDRTAAPVYVPTDATGPVVVRAHSVVSYVLTSNTEGVCNPGPIDVDGTPMLNCTSQQQASPIVGVIDGFNSVAGGSGSTLAINDAVGEEPSIVLNTIPGQPVTVNFGGAAAQVEGDEAGNLEMAESPPEVQPTYPIQEGGSSYAAAGGRAQRLTLSGPLADSATAPELQIAFPIPSGLQEYEIAGLRILEYRGGAWTPLATQLVDGLLKASPTPRTGAAQGDYLVARLDTTPPGPISIRALESGTGSVMFQWTATGDDGNLGRASNYIIRHGPCPGGEFGFGNGTLMNPSPVPLPAGQLETVSFPVASGVSYCMGVVVGDSAGNQSGPFISEPSRPLAGEIVTSTGSLGGYSQREIRLESNRNDLSLVPLSPEDHEVRRVIEANPALRAVSTFFRTDPPGVTFLPAARLTLNYPTLELAGRQADLAKLRIYGSAGSEGQVALLGNQANFPAYGYVEADVTTLPSILVVMEPRAPETPEAGAPSGLEVTARSSDSVTLSWGANNAPQSRYLVVYSSMPALSCSALRAPTHSELSGPGPWTVGRLAPSMPYAFATCSLTASPSCAGFTAVLTATFGTEVSPSFITCPRAPPPQTLGGLALRTAPDGRLWGVFAGVGGIFLSRFAADGTHQFTRALPDATDDGRWSIGFGPSGQAYAVGTAMRTDGRARAAVYPVAADGTVSPAVLSDEAGEVEAIALASSGEVWIAGLELGAGDPPPASLALWHYSPQTGQLLRRASFARGNGLDAGAAVRLIGDNVWVAGYSRAPGTPQVDLALWRFGLDGTLDGGPFLRPGYFGSVSPDELPPVRLGASEGGPFMATSKSRTGGSDLGVIAFDAQGGLRFEKIWSAADGRASIAQGLVTDAGGGLLIAGMLRTGGGSETGAVWSYRADGGLGSVKAVPAGSGALRDVAIASEATWLAVESRLGPLSFQDGPAVPGTDILIEAAPLDPALSSITVVPSSLHLAAGSGHQFRAIGTFNDSSTRTLSWTGWSPIASMPSPLGHVAGAVLDGKLHTLGGWDQNFVAQAHHFIYDPASNSWSTGTALPEPRFGANAAVVDGRIYLVAGAATGHVYTRELRMYDPAADSWTAKAQTPYLRNFMSVGVIDGKIYAAGGNLGGSIDDKLWMYDPATDAWTLKAPIPEPHYIGFSGVINGRFYLFGGMSNAGKVERGYAYDPPTDTWAEVAPLPTWRYGGASGVAAVSAVWDGKLYAIGGLPQGTDVPVRTVEVYDPVTNSWTTGPDAIFEPWNGPGTGVIDGAIYVAGGGEAGRTTAFAQGLGGGDVVWSVDAPAVASITPSGFVTGLAAGAAKVYASTGAISGFSDLTVHPTYFITASADGAARLGSGNEEQVVTPVSTETASAAYAAAVNSQGLALASPALYEITPSPVVFDPPALLTMTFDPTVVDSNTVALYRYQDPLWSSAPITGQTVVILAPNLAQVSGFLSSASLYAAFSVPLKGPDLALQYPAPGAAQVESAVGGIVHVRGSVGEGAVSWTLKVGTQTVAAGQGTASGELAAFDSAPFPGARQLTLSAVNASGAVTSTSAAIFVGAPAFAHALGRKDSDVIVASLKGPAAVAVRQDGRLWVTSEDTLLRLTADGMVEAEVGGLKNPQGVALDGAGRVYVADHGNDRVVRLSADGGTVELSLGRQKKHEKPAKGSGPGEFHAPWDVAVDANGDVYVADAGNRRIQVFDEGGGFLRQFGPGLFSEEAQLRGIALSTEGLWVSDREQGVVLLLSREGALLGSVDDDDSVVGEIARTRGVATDRFGALYVTETSRDRVQKFDAKGSGLLAFGSKSAVSPAEKAVKRFLTEPVDAALAPDGALWVADTGRDRVVRYALPVADGFGLTAAARAPPGRVEPARRLVAAEEGARVERDDGTGVTVPKDALAADLEITVAQADAQTDAVPKQASRAQKRIAAASEEVEYGPEGTRFSKPVTLTISYDPAPGLDESKLKVHYWNPSSKEWEALDSVVDTRAKTVSAQTTHFSVYQVQGAGAGIVPAAAVDEFNLRDQYAFPNPSRRGQAVTFRVQPGLADSVEIRVYDVAGRKVHESSRFNFTAAFDDGNGKGPQHTYDHVWDVGGVGSGVYRYVITARRAGRPDIRVSGKAGVIK